MVKLNGMLYSGAVLLVLLGTVWGLVGGSVPEPAKTEEQAQPQSRVLGEHRYAVRCLAFAPDGKTLATGDGYPGAPGEIKLWDVSTGRELTTLRGSPNGFYTVAFAPNGQTLAGVSFDQVLTLWDVATGRELARVPVSVPSFLHTVLAPDGRTLAMVGWKGDPGSVQLWQVDREAGDSLTGGSGPFTFSADSHRLALWRLAADSQGATVCPADRQDLTPVAKLKDLPAGQWWDIPLGRQRSTLCGDGNFTWAVAFSPDGQTLASGGFAADVKLWDLATGRRAGCSSRTWRPDRCGGVCSGREGTGIR